ncbi:unnamed protein product [Lactuca virosa]|uniref:Uncharacterized protein n=1 Tax=Lactuca virosa TaxID=75947 RepID=A0AAU9NMP6_9ASTR|nr:unnamed protein product [Lactuca virosa]
MCGIYFREGKQGASQNRTQFLLQGIDLYISRLRKMRREEKMTIFLIRGMKVGRYIHERNLNSYIFGLTFGSPYICKNRTTKKW